MYCQTNHGPWAGEPPYYRSMSASPFFAYLFEHAGVQGPSPDRLAALDALGLAMVEQEPAENDNSQIPPIFTYLGQFIDHDITAGTDRDQQGSQIDADKITPRDRADVVKQLVNFRNGRLNLDSLYGGGTDGFAGTPEDEAFVKKLTAAMRHPSDSGKMRVAFFDGEQFDQPPGAGSVDFPIDRAGDLLRLGRLTRDSNPVTLQEVQALSPEMQKMFLREDGTLNMQRAIIGDGRNDENLFVAQVHLAFLRLHNTIAQKRQDHLRKVGKPVASDDVFAWTRKRVTWIYQWLVVNVYLPRVCDERALAAVMQSGGAMYADLLTSTGWKEGNPLPLPIEFSIAAFRFGHSMVRASYDWNSFFGRPTPDKGNILPTADFQELFNFTGSGGLRGSARLPGNWGADWERLISGPVDHTDRATRKIDTLIAFPMTRLENGMAPIISHLAQRNLRRDHLLNMPSAQDCVTGLQAYDPALTPLVGTQLGDGTVGVALDAADLRDATPLWYYVLREGEVLCGGQTLGPVGTHLVGGTLLGLIVNDDTSYWHATGHNPGNWTPADLVDDGLPQVDSLRALLKTALLLP